MTTSFAAEIEKLTGQLNVVFNDMRIEAANPGMKSKYDADSLLGDLMIDALANVALGGAFAPGGVAGAAMDAISVYDSLVQDMGGPKKAALGQYNVIKGNFGQATKGTVGMKNRLMTQLQAAQAQLKVQDPKMAAAMACQGPKMAMAA